ncbi:MAG: hypothetical protein KF763_17580 [Cyclobacteriaceae bacterium]|nr:hypothetical protein [Cyclobacteriaceae bacterium]
MRRFIYILVLSITLFLISYQSPFAHISNVINPKKIRYSKFLGVARSSFDVNGFPSSPSYSSLELRVGTGIIKPLGHYFDLKSGLSIGLKVKRNSYFFGTPNRFTNKQWVLPSLDETVSNQHHLFIEVPLSLQFRPKPKLSFRSGLNFRFWLPNDESSDVLAGRPEIGMLGGVSYALTSRIKIGLEHYYGLTNILSGSFYVNNSQLIKYHVRNQFTQITIERTF